MLHAFPMSKEFRVKGVFLIWRSHTITAVQLGTVEFRVGCFDMPLQILQLSLFGKAELAANHLGSGLFFAPFSFRSCHSHTTDIIVVTQVFVYVLSTGRKIVFYGRISASFARLSAFLVHRILYYK
jgi:hypothetical protein